MKILLKTFLITTVLIGATTTMTTVAQAQNCPPNSPDVAGCVRSEVTGAKSSVFTTNYSEQRGTNPLGLENNTSTGHQTQTYQDWSSTANNPKWKGPTPELLYYWDGGSEGKENRDGRISWSRVDGWETGLNDYILSVSYHARMYDEATGEPISDGDSVSLDTPFILEFVPHEDSDIYWFGPGGSMDSPYGAWDKDLSEMGYYEPTISTSGYWDELEGALFWFSGSPWVWPFNNETLYDSFWVGGKRGDDVGYNYYHGPFIREISTLFGNLIYGPYIRDNFGHRYAPSGLGENAMTEHYRLGGDQVPNELRSARRLTYCNVDDSLNYVYDRASDAGSVSASGITNNPLPPTNSFFVDRVSSPADGADWDVFIPFLVPRPYKDLWVSNSSFDASSGGYQTWNTWVDPDTDRVQLINVTRHDRYKEISEGSGNQFYKDHYPEWKRALGDVGIDCEPLDLPVEAYDAINNSIDSRGEGSGVPVDRETISNPPDGRNYWQDDELNHVYYSPSYRCQLTTEGEKSFQFDFDEQYGAFFYRYYDFRTAYTNQYGSIPAYPGCYGNHIMLHERHLHSSGCSKTEANYDAGKGLDRNGDGDLNDCANYSIDADIYPHIVEIPSQTIEITLTGEPNEAPVCRAGDELTGPTSGVAGQSVGPFTLGAGSDPDNEDADPSNDDTLEYCFDWDGDGGADPECFGSMSANHVWASTGTKTVVGYISDGLDMARCGDVAVVLSDNNLPFAVNDSVSTALDTSVSIDVLGNDSDPDGDTISIDSFTQPSNGSASQSGSQLVYSPSSGYTGSDSFTYTITDGDLTDSATVFVSVGSAVTTLSCELSSPSNGTAKLYQEVEWCAASDPVTPQSYSWTDGGTPWAEIVSGGNPADRCITVTYNTVGAKSIELSDGTGSTVTCVAETPDEKLQSYIDPEWEEF